MTHCLPLISYPLCPRLHLLWKLRSFGVQGAILTSFCDSAVASAIFYGVVCWRSSISAADRRRFEKLIKKPSSIFGCPLDPVQVVGEGAGGTGAGVPPPAGHCHGTGQTNTPQVCEGEVSQVLPSCCCQTVQPASLPIDLTVQYNYTRLISGLRYLFVCFLIPR